MRAYGAMMILAPGCGMGPMPSMVSGTWSSHWSSCLLRVGPSSEYQEPACVAGRWVMVGEGLVFEEIGGFRRSLEEVGMGCFDRSWGLVGLWRGKRWERVKLNGYDVVTSVDTKYEYYLTYSSTGFPNHFSL